MISSDVASIPGWYGKLPTLGDFASRRLEGDFIEPWDVWLGDCLQTQRESMGDAWLDAYLQSPPWRFVLMPGVLRGFDPHCALAGVLMPSVDRVGRYFPLTIAASTPPPSSAADYEALLTWLHRVEDTALDALQDDWSIDDLEEALAALAPPTLRSEPAFDHLAPVRAALAEAIAGEGGFVAIDGVASRTELASVFAGALAEHPEPGPDAVTYGGAGTAIWLADNPEHPQLLVSRGLPASADFIRMFGTSGREPRVDTMY